MTNASPLISKPVVRCLCVFRIIDKISPIPAQIYHSLTLLHRVGIREGGAALWLVVGDAVLGGTAAWRRIGRIIVEHAHVALADHRLIALDIRSATGSGNTGRTDIVLIPVKEEPLGIVAEFGILAVELALCNTVLAGIAAEGDKYFYVNPLEVWPDNCCESSSMSHVKPVRQPWFTCACCPSNIARTLASIGQYIYVQDEKSIYINQFISSALNTEIGNSQVSLTLRSSLPESGKVSIRISSEKPQAFTLRIRIPKYFRNVCFSMDGKPVSPATKNGYAVLTVSPSGEQELVISGTVEPQWVAANTEVRADAGKVALMYGPYVYCLEETDNAKNLAALHVSPKAEIGVSDGIPELPGNLPTLRFQGKRLNSFSGSELYSSPDFSFSDETLTAVPYALWCNRTPGEMTVWMKAFF